PYLDGRGIVFAGDPPLTGWTVEFVGGYPEKNWLDARLLRQLNRHGWLDGRFLLPGHPHCHASSRFEASDQPRRTTVYWTDSRDLLPVTGKIRPWPGCGATRRAFEIIGGGGFGGRCQKGCSSRSSPSGSA